MSLYCLIQGNNPEVQIYMESSTEGLSTTAIPLSSLSKTVTSTAFSSFTLDFSALPPNGSPLVWALTALLALETHLIVRVPEVGIG